MSKGQKFGKAIAILGAFILAIPTGSIVFAQSPDTHLEAESDLMSFETARDYLLNYKKVITNQDSSKTITTYEFKSDEKLDEAATYISKYGLKAFNNILSEEIEKALEKEPKTASIVTRTVDPVTITKKISGNGTHTVSGQASGLAKFDTLGTAEYIVKLSYKAYVKNNKITQIDSISFDIPYAGPGDVTWGDLTFNQNVTSKSAAVTANYRITKSVSVGKFEIVIKSEFDPDAFAVLASLK